MKHIKSEFLDIYNMIEESQQIIRAETLDDPKQISTDIWRHQPVSPLEFIEGREFINDRESNIWPAVREDLQAIFSGDDKFGRPSYFPCCDCFFDIEGIGSGKSFKVSIFNAYYAYLLLCLKDPISYFGLYDSTLLFLNVAPKEDKAQIIYKKTANLINSIPWFIDNEYLPEKRIKSELRFYRSFDTREMSREQLEYHAQLESKGLTEHMPFLVIRPGSSNVTEAVGEDLLVAIIDEACSPGGFETATADKCEEIHREMQERIFSRFTNHGGVSILISSAGHENRYLEERVTQAEEFRVKHDVSESQDILPIEGERIMYRRRPAYRANPKYKQFFDNGETFTYEVTRQTEDGVLLTKQLEIPLPLKKKFEANPERALVNICAISGKVGDKYIKQRHLILQNIDRERQDPYPDKGDTVKCTPHQLMDELPKWWVGDPNKVYYAHIDLGTSKVVSGRDFCGLTIGCAGNIIKRGDTEFNSVRIDLVVRFKTEVKRTRTNKDGKTVVSDAQTELQFSEVRDFLIWAHQKRGFKFAKITFDGWQSTDSIQQLQKLGYLCEKEGCTNESYDTMKSYWYDGRLNIYHNKYVINQLFDLVIKPNGKIDHPVGGHDDVIQTVARVAELVTEGELPHSKKRARPRVSHFGRNAMPQRPVRGPIIPGPSGRR